MKLICYETQVLARRFKLVQNMYLILIDQYKDVVYISTRKSQQTMSTKGFTNTFSIFFGILANNGPSDDPFDTSSYCSKNALPNEKEFWYMNQELNISLLFPYLY